MGRLLAAGLAMGLALSTRAEPLLPRTAAEELNQARSALAGLHERYGEQNPRLAEARLRVTEWERLARAEKPEPVSLQRARVERAVMGLRYLEKHPDLVAQQARVAAMDRQWQAAPSTPDALLEAIGELAALGTHLGEGHPRYQDQARKVAALRRYLLGPGKESSDLRTARALQEYYSGRYDANHPKMREIAAQITELEKK